MAKKASRKQQKALSLRLVLFYSVIFSCIAFFTFFPLKKGEPCANSISCVKNLTGKWESTKEGVFMGKKVTSPQYLAKDFTTPVLGNSTENKKIFVDLTGQHLYAYEGYTMVYNFPISSGKWYPTPTGEFTIWVKLRYTRMAGGNPAIGTYYDLPNVPFVMFFSNSDVSKDRGFSLHGAYWHDNFGHPMSHGCVNISTKDAEKLYAWADPSTIGSMTYATSDTPGTPVKIYGEAPLE